MSQQTVFRFPTRTSFSDLTTNKEKIPTPASHEVLIKVRAVSLNSRDCQIATSAYPFPIKDNVIPGSDAAGDIVALGDAVREFFPDLAEGDRVLTCFDQNRDYGPAKDVVAFQNGGGRDGVMAQYIVRAASAVVKVPRGAVQSYSELASLVCTGVTAWNALYGNVKLVPGQAVLVQGTGGTSMTALVLAKAAGATTIVTSSSETKLAAVREKVAPDHCINYRTTPDWASEAVRLTGGKGVDHIIEIGGLGTIEQSIAAVARGGVISIIGYLAEYDAAKVADVNIPLLALGKEAVLRGIQIGPRWMLEELVTFVVRRGLRFQVDREFAFERESIVDAYNALAEGKHVGKICVVVE
ncbi:NAD(P)-binding protein [Aspergillus pseudoustus]|uniref:NAD(P)-binding protein n=1 Tax=Aspergillus pseudoustus TaxID=1810923 RepID=A0ABR4KXX7_9EURO